MNWGIYRKHPFLGIQRFQIKLMCSVRGFLVALTYGSGKRLKIWSGALLECPEIQFGDNVEIGQGVHIFGGGSLTIGNNVVIGDGTVICCAGNLKIGEDTMIAAQCYITDCNHGTHKGKLMRLQPMRIAPVIIEDDVWIGCGSKILAGAEIGTGTVIGAGATITKKIDSMKFLKPERDRYQLVDRV